MGERSLLSLRGADAAPLLVTKLVISISLQYRPVCLLFSMAGLPLAMASLLLVFPGICAMYCSAGVVPLPYHA